MASGFDHVHFGAGKLGLGLIVPITKQAGFRTLVVTKSSGKENKEAAYSKLNKSKKYVLQIKKKKNHQMITTSQSIQLNDFHEYRESVSKKILEKIATKNLRLITTAVGESNLDKVSSEIVQIIRIRFKNKINQHLVIIACENLVSNSDELKKKINRLLKDEEKKYSSDNVFFCNCVVDRVCPTLNEAGKLVNVVAYEYYNWILNKNNLPKEDLIYLRKHFKKTKGVHFADNPEFELKQTLKIWCFNGIHLALAVYGRDALRNESALLSEAIGHDRISQTIRRLQNAYTYVISAAFKIDRKTIVKYQDHFIKRIKENDDDKIERIIDDLLRVIKYDQKFHEVEAFLKKVQDRLISPMIKFSEIGPSKINSSKLSVSKIQERENFLVDFIGLLSTVIKLMRNEIHTEITKRILAKIQDYQ